MQTAKGASAFTVTTIRAKVVITRSPQESKATIRSAQTKIVTTIEASEEVRKTATEVATVAIIDVKVGLRIEVGVEAMVEVAVSIILTREK